MHKRFRNSRFFRHIPTQESIRQYRFLRPFRRYLDHHALWQFNRRSVAGGLAIGLFFSVAIPVGQIPLALVFAIFCRVNIPIAAFATFLSNPFTTPAILYFAYKLGAFLTGQEAFGHVVKAEAEAISQNAVPPEGFGAWLEYCLNLVQSAGMPLIVGLLVISVLLALGGYFGVNMLWQWQAGLRWRARRGRRAAVEKGTVT